MPVLETSDTRLLTHVLGQDKNGLFGRSATGKLLVPSPAGFGWDFTTYPVNVYRNGQRRFSTDIDTRSKISSNVWSGPDYYVSPTGSNANTGLTMSSPLRSLWKARQLAEASAALGYKIRVVADPVVGFSYWDRNNDFNDTGGAGGGVSTVPTKPFALMAYGGQAYMGPIAAGLTFVDDGSGTRTYSVTRSNVATVIDITKYNRWGINRRLVKVATQALCQSTPGSWAMVGTTLYVHLEDGQIPGDSTCKVLMIGADALKLGTVDAYISGFGLLGSALIGAVSAYDVATRNVVMEDCIAGYTGIQGGIGRNSYSFDNMTGLVILNRCRGEDSTADHFNLHAASGSPHMLMIDCTGVDAGHAGTSPANQSNQITTLHETSKLISLNTKGNFSAGGCVRNIGATQMWDLGSEYFNDRGDVIYGGTQESAAIVMNDTAEYWGDSITVGGCASSFYATASAKIHLSEPVEMGGMRGGSGVIDSYIPSP